MPFEALHHATVGQRAKGLGEHVEVEKEQRSGAESHVAHRFSDVVFRARDGVLTRSHGPVPQLFTSQPPCEARCRCMKSWCSAASPHGVGLSAS